MNDIMLIGSGRSGTSFIQRIFDSHPDTYCLHEPDSLYPTQNPPFMPDRADYEALAPAAAAYVARLKRVRGLRAVQKQARAAKSYRGPAAHHVHHALLFLYRGLDAVLGRWLPVSTWPVPGFVAPGGAVTVLKSVESIGRLALIAQACPGLRVVHILRHPCGVAASRQRGRELGKMPPSRVFNNQLALPLARELGLTAAQRDAWDDLETSAWSWTLLNDSAMRESANMGNVYVLRYDMLCDDLLGQSQKLLTWCGLPWHPQIEAFLTSLLEQTVDANGYHAVIRNPAVTAHRWRETLSTADQEKIMAIARTSIAGRIFETDDDTHATAS